MIWHLACLCLVVFLLLLVLHDYLKSRKEGVLVLKQRKHSVQLVDFEACKQDVEMFLSSLPLMVGLSEKVGVYLLE